MAFSKLGHNRYASIIPILHMVLNLYLLDISDFDVGLLSTLIPKMSISLQDKISRFNSIQDKCRVLLSDIFVRKILSQELQIASDIIALEVGLYGKPYLKQGAREFNLSHSGDYILLGTDDLPIGVDIEYMQPLDDLENLVEISLSSKERERYKTKDEEQQLQFFYEIWTLKESYIKALGQGISYPLHSFSLNCSDEEIFLEEPANVNASWYFKRYSFDAPYKAAVCARCNQFPAYPTKIVVSNLLKET